MTTNKGGAEKIDLTSFVGFILQGKYNYDLPSLNAYLKNDTTFVNKNRDKFIVRKGKKNRPSLGFTGVKII